LSEHYCLRCKTVLLIEVEPISPRITFFECPNCRRQYALRLGKPLTFRGRDPIGLALYGVIFDEAPAERAAALASSFVAHHSPEQLGLLVRTGAVSGHLAQFATGEGSNR
jgi:hypothetical protein